jgi:hypothetical protein
LVLTTVSSGVRFDLVIDRTDQHTILFPFHVLQQQPHPAGWLKSVISIRVAAAFEHA